MNDLQKNKNGNHSILWTDSHFEKVEF